MENKDIGSINLKDSSNSSFISSSDELRENLIDTYEEIETLRYDTTKSLDKIYDSLDSIRNEHKKSLDESKKIYELLENKYYKLLDAVLISDSVIFILLIVCINRILFN